MPRKQAMNENPLFWFLIEEIDYIANLIVYKWNFLEVKVYLIETFFLDF